MSLSTKEIHEGAVSSISGTDLVMVSAPGGGYQPISFADIMKAVKSGIDLSKGSSITVSTAEWLRVAKTTIATFSAILTITTSWTSGRPTPLVAFIHGSSSNADGYNACQITKGSFYEVLSNPPASSNPGLSFTDLRFVKEGNDIFVEVKFKPNAKITYLHASLAGQIGAIALVDATVSTADAANVLKTIDFSGGGVTNCQSVSYAFVSEKGGAHDADEGLGVGDEQRRLRRLFGEPLSVCNGDGREAEKGEPECDSSIHYANIKRNPSDGLKQGNRTWNISVGGIGYNIEWPRRYKHTHRYAGGILPRRLDRNSLPTCDDQKWHAVDQSTDIRLLERLENTDIAARKEVAL